MNLLTIKKAKVLDEAELTVLCGSNDTEVGKVIYKIVQYLREKRRAINEERPVISDDLRKDFRTVNGEISLCNTILDLPRAARIILTKEEKE